MGSSYPSALGKFLKFFHFLPTSLAPVSGTPVIQILVLLDWSSNSVPVSLPVTFWVFCPEACGILVP